MKYICDWYYNKEDVTEEQVEADLAIVLNDPYEFDDDIDTYVEYASKNLGIRKSLLLNIARGKAWLNKANAPKMS